ncbi:MAG: hypothetical protein M0Q38_09145 [Bacteroidales bacterium]|jgi:hypothetical protein|nr:hypothetical protein [Bacteroidales bacterium]
MKNIIKFLALVSLIVCAILVSKPIKANPPDPPSHHGETTNQAPAGAPIDGGLGILLALGAGYGGRKLYKSRKKKEEAENDEIEE